MIVIITVACNNLSLLYPEEEYFVTRTNHHSSRWGIHQINIKQMRCNALRNRLNIWQCWDHSFAAGKTLSRIKQSLVSYVVFCLTSSVQKIRVCKYQQDTRTSNLGLGVSGANDPPDRKVISNDLEQNRNRSAATECNRTGTLYTNESECIITSLFWSLKALCNIDTCQRRSTENRYEQMKV